MTKTYRADDLVSYEDMANPRRVYRVVPTPQNWPDYCLQDIETGEYTYSDLRQAGWRPISVPFTETELRALHGDR